MPQSGKTFRIFISSTFADLKKERNALQEKVFPRLRDLCMQHGARFQAIDLRWGVSAEAGTDQQTLNICLEEIRRCRRVTPRPNFIVLLGQRYGWLPLPPQIPADEFSVILRYVPPTERALISWEESLPASEKGWYRLDENVVPAEYVLQPRTGEYTVRARWTEVETRMHSLLLGAAHEAGLSAEAMVKYERSATELEILEGALQAGEEHAFAYFRTIAGLPEDERTHNFCDLDSAGKPDADSARLINNLKTRLIDALPASHVHAYQAKWSAENDITDAHLDALCVRVQADLSRVILEELDKSEQQSSLSLEIESHNEFGQERARHFRGREETLTAIEGYLVGTGVHPLVVYGPPGSGKSALMAHAVERTQTKHQQAVVVSRFLGATPTSSDIRSLLESLCQQIGQEYGSAEPVPTEYRELLAEFPKRLALATPQKRLLLFLDALDQLSTTDNAQTLKWLPRELPSNVRLVTTVLEQEGPGRDCLRATRTRLAESSLLPLPPMAEAVGAEILKLWLDEAKRTLTPAQRREVLSKFRHTPLPLYLRIVFQEARRWKSYDPVADLPSDTQGVLHAMLARLEMPPNHGSVMVSRVLGYLAAARNGLTEDELLDVLWADEDVKSDFYERNKRSGQLDCLPVVIWSRMFFDLESYLTERHSDGFALISFYHREIGSVVHQRYLGLGNEIRMHQLLADYFCSQRDWLDDLGRRPSPADTLSVRENRPNLRRASELPWQLMKSGQWEAVGDLLTNLSFLESKVDGGMVHELAQEIAVVLASTPSTLRAIDELTIVEQTLRLDSFLLSRYPHLLHQQIHNRSDRSLTAGSQLAHSTVSRPWLRQTNGPHRSLVHRTLEVGETSAITALACNRETGHSELSLVAAGHADGVVRLWDLDSGRQCIEAVTGGGKILAIAFSCDQYIYAFTAMAGIVGIDCMTGTVRASSPAVVPEPECAAFAPVTNQWTQPLAVFASRGEGVGVVRPDATVLRVPNTSEPYVSAVSFLGRTGKILIGGIPSNAVINGMTTARPNSLVRVLDLAGNDEHVETAVWHGVQSHCLGWVVSVWAAEDGSWFVTASQTPETDEHSEFEVMWLGEVVIWRPSARGWEPIFCSSRGTGCTAVAVFPTASIIVGAKWDDGLTAWDGMGKTRGSAPLKTEQCGALCAVDNRRHPVLIAAEGSLLRCFTVAEFAALEDTNSHLDQRPNAIDIAEPIGYARDRSSIHSMRVSSADLSPDLGRVVSGSSDESVVVQTLGRTGGSNILWRHNQAHRISSVAFDCTGELIYVGGYDWTVRSLATATGKTVAKYVNGSGRIGTVTVSPTGEYVIAINADGTAMVILDKNLKPVSGAIRVRCARNSTPCSVSHGDRFIAFASELEGVMILELSNDLLGVPGSGFFGLTDIVVGEHTVVPLPMRWRAVSACTFGLSSDVLAVCGDGQIWTLDLRTREIRRQWDGEATAFAFCPGDRYLACGFHDRVIILCLTTREVVWQTPTESPVLALRFSPDGGFIGVVDDGSRTSFAPLVVIYTLVGKDAMIVSDFVPQQSDVL